jgi:hypothetical protein
VRLTALMWLIIEGGATDGSEVVGAEGDVTTGAPPEPDESMNVRLTAQMK